MSPTTTIIRHLPAGTTCCDPDWESAYARFETPQQEIDKFTRRLRAFGFEQLAKEQRIAELFCGRGGGLVALQQLGFSQLEGVDLSEELLKQYRGPATLHLADCRRLPFETGTLDAVVVQGGLHHLPSLPDDLDEVLGEVTRVLRSDGLFYVVEPWLTPFLRFVHAIVERRWVRKIYAKGDALAEMIEHERETYEHWLSQPQVIMDTFEQHFHIEQRSTAWGKLMLVASAKRESLA